LAKAAGIYTLSRETRAGFGACFQVGSRQIIMCRTLSRILGKKRLVESS